MEVCAESELKKQGGWPASETCVLLFETINFLLYLGFSFGLNIFGSRLQSISKSPVNSPVRFALDAVTFCIFSLMNACARFGIISISFFDGSPWKEALSSFFLLKYSKVGFLRNSPDPGLRSGLNSGEFEASDSDDISLDLMAIVGILLTDIIRDAIVVEIDRFVRRSSLTACSVLPSTWFLFK